MRLIAYVRVSTIEQAENGQGLAIQQADLKRWADNQGHIIVATYADEGLSGTKGLEDRPALAEAIEALRLDDVDGILFPSLDRLARTLEVQETVLATIWKMGSRAFIMDGEVLEDDIDDPLRTFVRKILGLVSELEAAQVKARLSKGRKARREATGWAGGAIPFGYRTNGKGLLPVVAEQKTLARMAELRSEGKSYRRIASTLASEGYKPRRAEVFHPNVIREVLANDREYVTG